MPVACRRLRLVRLNVWANHVQCFDVFRGSNRQMTRHVLHPETGEPVPYAYEVSGIYRGASELRLASAEHRSIRFQLPPHSLIRTAPHVEGVVCCVCIGSNSFNLHYRVAPPVRTHRSRFACFSSLQSAADCAFRLPLCVCPQPPGAIIGFPVPDVPPPVVSTLLSRFLLSACSRFMRGRSALLDLACVVSSGVMQPSYPESVPREQVPGENLVRHSRFVHGLSFSCQP